MATVPQRRVAPWGHHQSLEVGKGHWLDFCPSTSQNQRNTKGVHQFSLLFRRQIRNIQQLIIGFMDHLGYH